MESTKHFVLVHGGCHGAWCSYKVVTLLKSSGHRVTALDLGGCGADPKRLDEIGSFSDYAHPVMEFMASLPEDERVVLVGHSYGGLTISLAMERFPQKISVAVFVTALMPNYTSPPATLLQKFFNTAPAGSLLDCQIKYDRGLENPPSSVLFGPDCLANKLYKHCQPEDVELAKMLVRPSGFFVEDFAKESLLTEEKFGSVDRVFVVCEDDDVFKVEFQQWVIDSSAPKDVKLIEGAGHMVMVSKPTEICLCLQDIAKKYN